jgi:magnesium chelatase family protein
VLRCDTTRSSVAVVLARAITYCIDGLDSRRVSVEVDVRQGLPAFVIVGLGDLAVREARERVRGALLNSGFEFPLKRIVVNLAPAHLRKNGSGFDLAIACAVLAASGQVSADAVARRAVYGELSLTGSVRGCRGTLAVAQAAARHGLDGLIVARERAAEAALVADLDVLAIESLAQLTRVLGGLEAPCDIPAAPEPEADATPDLADVLGQRTAIEGLTIAAAGGHNVLMQGPPGTGKTMLARRVPGLLPPLTEEEAIEVTRIHSVAGIRHGGGLMSARPFRAPHHSISPSGLVGGGLGPAPGEATLAHHGVLFLDELSEFHRGALEALRQPLEDGRVAIVRGQRTAVFPTQVMLLAATNPCPCGFGGERCRCSESEKARHRRRLSGPLLDRMDIVIDLQRPDAGALAGAPTTDSATVRATVTAARDRQARRLAGSSVRTNARMSAAQVRRLVPLDAAGRRALAVAYDRDFISARGHDRVLRVARTIADVEGCEQVSADHVLRAVSMRQLETTHAKAVA